MTWRGEPLTTCRVNFNRPPPRPRTGLRVMAELDQRPYPTGIKVTDVELAAHP
jgi:hypothetical protein